jgi:NADH dehydrogenase (ubiquinone) Fe-S protein 5
MSTICISTFFLFNHRLTLQIARAKAIKEEFVKKAQHQAAEGRKIADVLADGVITGVGLIQRDGGAKTQ